MKHFGKKVTYKEWTFDSIKERDFFIRFIENSGKRFAVHKSFELLSKFSVGGYKQRSITYAPDFVVYDADGRIEHVYGFTTNRIQDPHARYDRHGNMKRKKNGEPMYDYYDVHKSVNYDIRDTIGW